MSEIKRIKQLENALMALLKSKWCGSKGFDEAERIACEALGIPMAAITWEDGK